MNGSRSIRDRLPLFPQQATFRRSLVLGRALNVDSGQSAEYWATARAYQATTERSSGNVMALQRAVRLRRKMAKFICRR